MKRSELSRLLETTAAEAAKKAIAEMPSAVRRMGTVSAVSGALASVLVDGDDEPIEAQVFVKLPTVNARVLVEFERGAARVVGIQGGFA